MTTIEDKQDTSLNTNGLEARGGQKNAVATCQTEETEIERLLVVSRAKSDTGSRICGEVKVPEGFRKEVETRRQEGLIDVAVARYYLETLPRGDSSTVPGQQGRPSLLQAILTQDHATLGKENVDGFGWSPVRKLGRGTHGAVILWKKNRRKSLPLLIATKDTRVSNFFQDYCSEAHLTRRLNDLGCKNVINVVEWRFVARQRENISDEVSWTPSKHRIAYEYAEHGDLHRLWRWYHKHRLIFPEPFIWHILHSIANALCFCSRGSNESKANPGWDSIVHGDIKQENIFLTAVDPSHHALYPTVKLADFGIAYTVGVTAVQHYRSTRAYGTDGYMAPEVLNNTPELQNRRRAPHELHGPHSDIFSLGVTIVRCFTLLKPHNVPPDTVAQLIDGPLPPDEQILLYYSAELHNLLGRCGETDPRDRPRTYMLYRLTKAKMEMYQSQSQSEMKTTQSQGEGEISPASVLFSEEQRRRYENDGEFRERYRRANLQGLPDYLDARGIGESSRKGSPSSGSSNGEESGSGDSVQQVKEKAALRAGVGNDDGKGKLGIGGLWKKFAAYRL